MYQTEELTLGLTLTSVLIVWKGIFYWSVSFQVSFRRYPPEELVLNTLVLIPLLKDTSKDTLIFSLVN